MNTDSRQKHKVRSGLAGSRCGVLSTEDRDGFVDIAWSGRLMYSGREVDDRGASDRRS